jgi:hypothetical protein
MGLFTVPDAIYAGFREPHAVFGNDEHPTWPLVTHVANFVREARDPTSELIRSDRNASGKCIGSPPLKRGTIPKMEVFAC